MQRPGALLRMMLIAAASQGFSAGPLQAIDVAVPHDMFRWTIQVNNAPEGQYYYAAASTSTDQYGPHSYLLTFDWEGNLVYYRKPLDQEERVDVFLPFDYQHRFMFSTGDVDESLGVVIMDSTQTPIDTIQHFNPHNPDYILDAHDVLMLDNGSMYTTWRDTQIVDMSQHIPGGDPNALVASHVIEHWDADHNLLWSWNGHDHVDRLPYTGRIDSTALSYPIFEHMHVNSLELFPDGDLLVSARQMSILFRLDRETGDVVWRFGGGPLNDFEFSNSTGEDVPLDFSFQHDGRVLPNGNITLFDNGWHHAPRESYAREYVMDEDNFTAELINVVYQVPRPANSRIHGSVRRYVDGHTLIGWGSITPNTFWQEFDENGVVVFQGKFLVDLFNDWQLPRCYRMIRSEYFPVAANPYLSEYLTADYVELYANWWGHESEITSYDVYWGQTNPPPFHGNTDSGTYTIPGNFLEGTWYGRVKALDVEGNEISPWSETLVLNHETDVSEYAIDTPVLENLQLSANWPNPFNTSTSFNVTVVKPEQIAITVYDLLGRPVQSVFEGRLTAGDHYFTVQAEELPSGVFFIRANGNERTSQVRRITLVK